MKTFLADFFCRLKEIYLFPFTEGFAINCCFGDPRHRLTQEEAEELRKWIRETWNDSESDDK